MRRLLKKLPHKRRDDSSERRLSSQSDPIKEPIKTPSPRPPTIFYDADDKDSTEPTTIASNGQPETTSSQGGQQSKDDAYNKRHSQQSKSKRTSTLSEPNKRQSGLVSYDQPVDTTSIHGSDRSKSATKANDQGLQLGPQDTSLYEELSYLTLGGDSRDAVDPSRKRYSEDVADRNVMMNEKGRLAENTAGRRGSVFHVPAQVDEFSEDIANRNIDSPSRSSTLSTELYPLETQQEMNRRIATTPFSSDEFYDSRIEQHSASSNPS